LGSWLWETKLFDVPLDGVVTFLLGFCSLLLGLGFQPGLLFFVFIVSWRIFASPHRDYGGVRTYGVRIFALGALEVFGVTLRLFGDAC
jgi:hypothetical protein